MSPQARYAVQLTPAADRQLDKLPAQIQRRITAVLIRLEDDPRPPGVRAIQGRAGALRLRVGDYRILYVIDDGAHEVLVLKVRHRRDVYER